MIVREVDRSKRLIAYAGKLCCADEILNDILRITSKGNDVVIRCKKSGQLEVYESMLRKPGNKK